jgi:colanic acid/amylovoran biosynthesis protein
MTLSLAVHSPKPVVIYAQSIGPFKRRFSKWITAKVVKRAALVLPREEHSLAELRSMGVSESRIELTGDEAFCLRPEKEVAGQEEYAGAVGTSLRVGMAPRPWNFGYGPDQVLLTMKYRDSLVQTIDWLTGEKQATVYMVANFVSPSGDNDRLYIENELIPRLKRPDRVVQLPDLDARGLMRLYAGLDLFVGTRMHANIFALTAGTPTVAIAYLPKTTGIMEMLGLREQVILIDEINPETLQRVVDQVIRDRSALRHRIATAVQEMIVRSRRNALAVKELLQRRAA